MKHIAWLSAFLEGSKARLNYVLKLLFKSEDVPAFLMS